MIGALLVSALPLFTQGKTSLRHADPDDRFAARSCAVCHQAAYDQWQISRHAHAATNAIYAVSAAHFSRSWCTNCHAPMETASEGVSCAACHVRDGEILTANAPTDSTQLAHAARHEPALSEASFCAGCHEFPFPDRHALDRGDVVYSDRLLQKTYSEWRRSDAERACQSCHMKDGAHTFPGAHDETFVRAAIALDVRREQDTIVAELRTNKVAHHVPTGDPFRRLVLSLCADATCTHIVATALFGRSFERERVVADTALRPDEARQVRIAARAPFYRLDYFFGDTTLEAALAPHDVSFEISRGQVKGSP